MKISLGVVLALAIVLLACWAYTTFESAAIARRFPPQGSFVDIGGGVKLHYTERLPAGPVRDTVLLLHGASGNQADLMVPLGDRLAARGFRVLAFDRPGHGWSDRPDGEADSWPNRQADLILQGLARIGVHRAIVLGHSWAGSLAAEIALDHPDVTRGLVLLSPVLYPWPTGLAWYYGPAASRWLGPAFTHTLTLPVGRLLLPAGIAEVFTPQRPPADFAARTGVALVLRPDEFAANAEDVFHLHEYTTRLGPRIPDIDVPTALVAGDGDVIAPSGFHAGRAAREIRGATLTILHGRGHSPHWSDPDVVVAAVDGVETRIEREAAAKRDASVPAQ